MRKIARYWVSFIWLGKKILYIMWLFSGLVLNYFITTHIITSSKLSILPIEENGNRWCLIKIWGNSISQEFGSFTTLYIIFFLYILTGRFCKMSGTIMVVNYRNTWNPTKWDSLKQMRFFKANEIIYLPPVL